MPTHSSILAWRIPLTEEPGCKGCKELDMTEQLTPSSERDAREIILETLEAAILPAMHQRRKYDT